MTQQDFCKTFWKQYLLLEKDFLETDEYVTIDKSNYKTFSNRYTYLFLNICSEIDTLAEQFCKNIGQSTKGKNLPQKMDSIFNSDSSIKHQSVVTKYPYEKINLVPFSKFEPSVTSDWWQDYNVVKHDRTEKPEKGIPNYQLAHLKNVIHSLAGLYVLCIRLYKKLEDNQIELEKSRLFE